MVGGDDEFRPHRWRCGNSWANRPQAVLFDFDGLAVTDMERSNAMGSTLSIARYSFLIASTASRGGAGAAGFDVGEAGRLQQGAVFGGGALLPSVN